MGKLIKNLIQKELESKLTKGQVKEFMVISLLGVNGVDNNNLRGHLKKKGINLLIVKNSLIKRVLQDQKIENAAGLFTGSCALAFGGDSVVDIAREVVDWAKKVPAIKVKGAFVDGTSYDEKTAIDFAKMPSRAELQGAIVVLVTSPAGKIASAIASPASVIASCLKSIIEKGEKAA